MCNPPETLSYISGSRGLRYNSLIEVDLGNGLTGEATGAILCYQIFANVTTNATKWQVNNFDVDYCMSERIQESCGFSINLAAMLVVILCNLGKVIAMAYISFGNLEEPLITIGDAVSSFLENPDRTTNGMCTVGRRDFAIAVESEKYIELYGERAANHHLGEEGWANLRQPRAWEPSSDHWFSASSERRRWTCIAL